MPINHAIWSISDKATPLALTGLDSEKVLEDLIVETPGILNPNWMIVGRQITTDFKGIIDILAIQPDGSPVLIELKRDKTPRDVTAQLLDYASWVEGISPERLQQIYESFVPGGNLQKDFEARFNTEWDDENLSTNQQMVLVASELDSASERIVTFLADKGVNINVLFFQVFKHGEQTFLSRSWLVDPVAVQSNATSPGGKGAWNGEYYANFGVDASYRWEDAINFGFITASGGVWYTQTLRMLNSGDRVWVTIPKTGYVGVGIVTGEAQPVTEFTVSAGGVEIPITEAETLGDYLADGSSDECAWFVPIDWKHTVPESKAVKEVGFFGNQNSVARPKSDRWDHTVKTLKNRWSVQ